MKVEGKALRKQRLQLIGLAALFIAPMLISYVAWKMMQSDGVWSTSNAGQLIRPAVPLDEFELPSAEGAALNLRSLRPKWTYVTLATSGCDENCRKDLYNIRQLRTSVNKDIDRVQRLLVVPTKPDEEFSKFLKSEHPDLIVAIDAGDGPLLSQFVKAGVATDGSRIYLLDPLANLMMSYSREVPWKGMFKDIRKLLKTSQIG